MQTLFGETEALSTVVALVGDKSEGNKVGDGVLELRGHHLETLGNFVANARNPRITREEQRRDFLSNRIRWEYGSTFAEKSWDIYSSIYDNPELEVRLVDFLDSVCGRDCLLGRESWRNCDTSPRRQDHNEAAQYGLQIRKKPYKARELVAAVSGVSR